MPKPWIPLAVALSACAPSPATAPSTPGTQTPPPPTTDPTTGTTTSPTLSVGGPLRVHAANPRYFDDGTGRAVVLVGANHGWELQDDAWSTEYALDYPAFLDYLESYDLNFIRLWRVESALQSDGDTRLATPMPFARTGPDFAHDGQPRYDLSRFEAAYFDRLRERIELAGERGIYVDVMLFERHSTFDHNGGVFPWRGHPMHADNNANGVDGDVDGDGQGREVFLLPEEGGDPDVLAFQEAYVREVIATIAPYDNVLVEVCNECKPEAAAWQQHMLDVARAAMQADGVELPLGFTGPGKTDEGAFPDFGIQLASTAEFVSPRDNTAYRDDPPVNDGTKVIFADSDHIDPFGRDEVWVWKSFLRGLHPQALEAYQEISEGASFDPVRDELVRLNMGWCNVYARDYDLASTEPRGDLASSGYALANEGEEYLVWAPDGAPVAVDLSGATGSFEVIWLEVATGVLDTGTFVDGGSELDFQTPFAGHSVLLLTR